MDVESEKVKSSTASKTSSRRTSQISKELTKVTQTLETFSACHKVLVRASDKSELLNRICQAIVEVGGYKMAWVGVVSQDSQKTVKPLAYAGYDDGFLSTVRVTWSENEKNLCPTGRAIVSREPFVLNNILSHPDVMSWRGEALKRGYGSVIALPLISNGGTFGSLTIFSDEQEGFALEDVNHLMDLAGNLVYGIVALHTRTERNRAEVEVKKNLKKLRQTLGAIIQVLEKTVEVRDPYTAGHQRRVADLARGIGSEMSFSQDRIDGIRIAGIIHDIGKIYVPAEILSKPRKLTTYEFNLIKTHPQVGYDILKSIEFPWPVAKIVLQHHERLNGTGYPNKLMHDNILIEARILGIADVVEAMASHRPYRPALGLPAALKEIASHKGTLYDAQIADICIQIFNDKKFSFEP
ncbi:HD domain-containing phosphohydrolase [Acidobacteriota bacterium]